MIELNSLKSGIKMKVFIFIEFPKIFYLFILLEILFSWRSCFIAIKFGRVIIITSQCAVFGVPSIVTVCPWQGKCQTISRIVQGPTNNDIVIE